MHEEVLQNEEEEAEMFSVWLPDVWIKCTFNLKLAPDLCMYIVLINECFNTIIVTCLLELLT